MALHPSEIRGSCTRAVNTPRLCRMHATCLRAACGRPSLPVCFCTHLPSLIRKLDHDSEQFIIGEIRLAQCFSFGGRRGVDSFHCRMSDHRTFSCPSGGQRYESNARFVRWSDGSRQLLLGDEVLDVAEQDVAGDQHYLFVRHQGLIQVRAREQIAGSIRP